MVEAAPYQTVVYRQAPRKSYARLGDDASYQDDQAVTSHYTRAVQTVRFVNPDARGSNDAIATGASGSAILALSTVFETQPLIKVGGFVAFPAKEAAPTVMGTPRHAARKRGAAIMDPVDDYLWEVYQRLPTKKDSTGDFTWKDPAAAKRAGMSLDEYVIGGMDPEFKEQLYHAGRAMDAAGLQWSMLSAFRDDYRQRLAKGFKARIGNSLHGGSRATGGFGHGRAIDITNAEGDADAVWQWIDAHGAKYGLHRPIPGPDPAHLQSKGDWRKLALSLRESRVRVADEGSGRGRDSGKSKVASASR